MAKIVHMRFWSCGQNWWIIFLINRGWIHCCKMQIINEQLILFGVAGLMNENILIVGLRLLSENNRYSSVLNYFILLTHLLFCERICHSVCNCNGSYCRRTNVPCLPRKESRSFSVWWLLSWTGVSVWVFDWNFEGCLIFRLLFLKRSPLEFSEIERGIYFQLNRAEQAITILEWSRGHV